jgi:hypothetical protein
MLICKPGGCRRAIEPEQLVRHLSNKHHVGALGPLVAGHFVGQLGWGNSTLRVPGDGLAPQPYVRVVKGFACKECRFRTTDEAAFRAHRTDTSHFMGDGNIFETVPLQSWFGDGTGGYWVVDVYKARTEQDTSLRKGRRDSMEGRE